MKYSVVKKMPILKKDSVNRSEGVNESFGILNSNGVDNTLFLVNKPKKYYIFGKKVNKNRFLKVEKKLYELLKNWRPVFNNLKSLYLKNGNDWKQTPVSNAQEISKIDAWKDMPRKAIKFIKSLDEYDEKMFIEITGIMGKVKDE